MRVFKTKTFSKWAKKNKISDAELVAGAIQLAAGSYEANLVPDPLSFD